MAQQSKEILKTYFETNKRPSQQEFENLIDSSLNLTDDKASDSDSQNAAVDNKFLTPKKAKLSTEAFAPVKSINGATGAVEIVDISGNADTATILKTPRTINGIAFDGSSNIVLPFEDSSNKYFSDFLQGSNIQFPFTGGNIPGGGSATAAIVGEANHPGQILLKKTPAVNTGYSIGTHSYAMVISPALRFEVIAKFPATLTNKVFRFGFNASSSITETPNGVYFEILNGGLVAKTAKTSVRTSNAIFNPSLNSWYHFIIHFDG